MYEPQPTDIARILNNFVYHKPHSVEQTNRCADVRSQLLEVASALLRRCPPSRELNLALTALEEAMMWGIAAIVRIEKEPLPVPADPPEPLA